MQIDAAVPVLFAECIGIGRVSLAEESRAVITVLAVASAFDYPEYLTVGIGANRAADSGIGGGGEKAPFILL